MGRSLGIAGLARAVLLAAVLTAAGCGGSGDAGDESADPGLPDTLGDEAVAPPDDLEPVDRGADEALPDILPDLLPDLPPDLTPDPGPPVDSDGDGLFDDDERARGTDPDDPDTDKDGQSDGKEVADGTDPLDPSSAVAWHPELTARPRLFFGPADIERMKARTAAVDGPHAVQWARMRSVADQVLPTYPAAPAPYDQFVSVALGAIAESAAMRGLLGVDGGGNPEIAYTNKALAALIVDFPDPSDLDANSDYDLREAETLVPMCIAFDLAAGTPNVDAALLAAARANLVKRIDTYRWMGHEGAVTLMLLAARNNHVMKFFATLGVCAMALNDRPEAAADMSEAMTGLDWMMNHWMSSPEGAWGEGWNYLVYGGRSYIPFFAAYHRWAAGRTLPYFGVPNLQPSDTPHTGRVDGILDFAANPRTKAVFDRALWSLQPDGRTPNTDDGNPEVLPGGMLAWLFDDPRFLFAWFRPAAGFPDQGSPVAAFALYDADTVVPADPGAPLEASAVDAGFAIFRSSWATDATYLVLQGEHGNTRTADPGHEHADELSFLLWHGGRPLLIDPGYINYTNHEKVMFAEDHNTILVDGQGAPTNLLGGFPTSVGVDAFLEPMTTDRFVTSTRVTTTYRGVTFARRIARVDGRFFVVEDRIDGGGTAHAYTWLMNGMGGADVPDSAFQELTDGARWRNGTARVEVRVQPVTGTATRDSDLQEHCTVWGQWAMHQRMKVAATMTGTAGFLALVLPTAEGEIEPPGALTLQPSPGVVSTLWTVGGTNYAAFSNQTAADWKGQLDDSSPITVPPGLTIVRRLPSVPALESVALAP
jgi:hypothetical protein